MSLDSQRAAHRVQHLVAATAHHFAVCSCLLTCGVTSTLHKLWCENMHVGSHAHTLDDHAQRFHGDWICHLWLAVRKSKSLPCPWLISKRARPCSSSCCIVRNSVAQKPFSSDVARARTRRIVSSPCQHLQISRKTLHDVPAVQAEILPLHKLLEQVSEESTQLNRKEELEARRIRLFRAIPCLASTDRPPPWSRRRQCSPAKVPASVRSAIATCATKTTCWALHYCSLGFDQKPRRDVVACFFPDVIVANATRVNFVQVGSLASTLPRMTADVATNMLVLILAGFAMLGVRVTCPDDPLLALRS